MSCIVLLSKQTSDIKWKIKDKQSAVFWFPEGREEANTSFPITKEKKADVRKQQAKQKKCIKEYSLNLNNSQHSNDGWTQVHSFFELLLFCTCWMASKTLGWTHLFSTSFLKSLIGPEFKQCCSAKQIGTKPRVMPPHTEKNIPLLHDTHLYLLLYSTWSTIVTHTTL